MRRRGGPVAGLAATLLALSGAPALAGQPQPPPPGAAQESLAAAEAALDGPGQGLEGRTPEIAAAEPSAALAELAAGLAQLDGRDRRRARALLARPTDGAADELGDGYPAGAPVSSAQSEHFCVFWVDHAGFADAPDLGDADGDGVPDYVAALLEIAEHSHATQVAPGPLGWPPPRPDGEGCGAEPGARADIYLRELGARGLFGYEAPDAGQGQARSQHGYLVLDNDYAPAEYGNPRPLDLASVTLAHEFNHLLQQNLDSFGDVWMFESTATWAEELVHPEIDDYLSFVAAFAATPGTPITEREGAGGLRIYGAAVWNHWLSRAYGVGVVRRAWEVSPLVRPADFAVAAYERAIGELGGRSFSREFARFVAATAEWRTGMGGFPDAERLPDVRRRGALRPGRGRTLRLDHTAYRLLRLRPGRARHLRLTVHAERGTRSALALVLRDGSALRGRAKRRLVFLPRGGRRSLRFERPRRYERITAVLVNADGRARGARVGERVYRSDGARFGVRLHGRRGRG